ncbi:MAG: HEAT repeat domain-containing protein, partial [Planctomycetota bacterium]
KKLLLPYVDDAHDEQTRRYALLSLAALGLSGEGHGDVISALIPILEDENEALARNAVDVLEDLKPRKSDADTLERLLENGYSRVQAYAIRALGRLGTVAYARRIAGFLGHRDHNLRAAAADALADMSVATDVLLGELHREHDEEYVDELIRVLGRHAKRVSRQKVRDLVKQLFDRMQANDPQYLVLRKAVLALDPEALRASVQSRCSAARRRKDYAAMRDCLRLLQGTEWMTPDMRFQLAVAKLKTSRKEMARAARQKDYALELVAEHLHEEGKAFTRKLLKESALEPEDLYYVGFHFSERLNEERRFGTDILDHIVKKHKRSKVAKAARDKLKVEGH